MGILTQSQINFLEKSNFQNCLNQQMLTPGEKNKLFLKNATTDISSLLQTFFRHGTLIRNNSTFLIHGKCLLQNVKLKKEKKTRMRTDYHSEPNQIN